MPSSIKPPPFKFKNGFVSSVYVDVQLIESIHSCIIRFALYTPGPWPHNFVADIFQGAKKVLPISKFKLLMMTDWTSQETNLVNLREGDEE